MVSLQNSEEAHTRDEDSVDCRSMQRRISLASDSAYSPSSGQASRHYRQLCRDDEDDDVDDDRGSCYNIEKLRWFSQLTSPGSGSTTVLAMRGRRVQAKRKEAHPECGEDAKSQFSTATRKQLSATKPARAKIKQRAVQTPGPEEFISLDVVTSGQERCCRAATSKLYAKWNLQSKRLR